MAQPANAAGSELKAKPRASSRVSNALKTGVVYGGSAVLTAVNNITPHIAGAVDILVIEQPDGTRKATPFYVRFGKYTALRTRERNVKLYINDELAPFGMHIGMYGQAYFATEAVEVREGGDEDEQEALLAGMMSPPSGYSSGAEEPSPQQDGGGEAAATLSAVRQRIDGMKEARRGLGKNAGAGRGPRVPLSALGVGAGVGPSGSPPIAAESTVSPVAPAQTLDKRSATSPGVQQRQDQQQQQQDQQQQQQQQHHELATIQVQMEPALSMADRNESFLSARETMATPLSDELVACAMSEVPPMTPPGSPGIQPQLQLRPQPPPPPSELHQRPVLLHPEGQVDGHGQGQGPLSMDSLGTGSEGGSPCGWSEDEEAAAGQGPLPEDKIGSPAGADCAQARCAASKPLPNPQLPQVQPQQQGLTSHAQNHLQHLHEQCLHPGVQQPLHQQLGFPENIPAAGGPAATALDCAAAGSSTAITAHSAVGYTDIPLTSSPPGNVDPGCPPPLELPRPPSASPHATPGAAAAALDGPGTWGPSCGATMRASLGAGPGVLAVAAAATTLEGHGCSGPGSGSGSGSAVSLLSTSLRSGSVSGGFGAPTGGSRSSLDYLRAKGNGVATAAISTPPLVLSASAFVQLPAAATGATSGGGALPLVGSAVCDHPVGPIAAAAAGMAARPWPSAVEQPAEERSVTLSLRIAHDGDVQASLRVLPEPVQAPNGTGSSGSHRGDGGVGETSGMEAAAGEAHGASDAGYLGDAEGSRATAMAAHVRQHHSGHHYHFAHGHGHGHLKHDPDGILHSTSAPLPSSAIHAASAAGAAVAAGGAVARGAPTAGIAPVAAASACGVGIATPAHGIELSLCGGHLKPMMPYATASALFDEHRVSEEAFFSCIQQMSGMPELAIRLSNGVIFPCQPLSYSLLGLLAFGTWRLPPGTTYWAPEGAEAAGASEGVATAAAAVAAAAMLAAAVAQGTGPGGPVVPKNGCVDGAGTTSSAATTPKKGQGAAATGSWRLWMFGSRRDGGRTSATGGGGVSSFISGRSPPLTSPIAERQSSVEHRAAGVSADTVPPLPAPPPPLPAAGTAQPPPLPSSQPCAAEGTTTVVATVAAIATADTMSGGFLPLAGSSTGGAGVAAAAVTTRENGPSASGSRRQGYHVVTKKSLTPTVEQLAALPLKHGQNTVMYKVGASELRAYVYYLPWRTRIVISDIDGTITKSDVLGHLLPAMGLDWSHPGIAELLTNIRQNNYLIMYLSSRSISQANITRDFINTLVQGQHRMPLGPVIISPHGLLPSLYREMILRRPHEFKIATLQDIRALFPSDWNPFYGGFGNRDTDEISYREVGVQPSRIFIINPRGELRQPIDSSPRGEAPVVSAAATPAGAAALADASKGQAQDDAEPGINGDGAEQPVNAAAELSLVAMVASTAPREVYSRNSVSANPVGRRASGGVSATTTTVQLSTLSAINQLVHDIFPPLRDGHPITDEAEEGSGSLSDGGQRGEGECPGGLVDEAARASMHEGRCEAHEDMEQGSTGEEPELKSRIGGGNWAEDNGRGATPGALEMGPFESAEGEDQIRVEVAGTQPWSIRSQRGSGTAGGPGSNDRGNGSALGCGDGNADCTASQHLQRGAISSSEEAEEEGHVSGRSSEDSVPQASAPLVVSALVDTPQSAPSFRNSVSKVNTLEMDAATVVPWAADRGQRPSPSSILSPPTGGSCRLLPVPDTPVGGFGATQTSFSPNTDTTESPAAEGEAGRGTSKSVAAVSCVGKPAGAGGGGCSAGSSTGAAVVDEVVATAVTLPA